MSNNTRSQGQALKVAIQDYLNSINLERDMDEKIKAQKRHTKRLEQALIHQMSNAQTPLILVENKCLRVNRVVKCKALSKTQKEGLLYDLFRNKPELVDRVMTIMDMKDTEHPQETYEIVLEDALASYNVKSFNDIQ